MKYLLSIIATMCSLVAAAQENTDSVIQEKPAIEPEVRLSMSMYTSLTDEKAKAIEEKNRAIENYNDLLVKYDALVTEDSIKSSKLKELNKEYPLLKDKYDALVKAQENADKKLFNTASNFLYIPYEAFSVEKIAIPAFEAINNPDIKTQYNIRYTLLKSYQSDIREILSFISESEKELNEPFVKDAKPQMARLQSRPFYQHYKANNDENTYLHQKIKVIEKQLKDFNGSTKKLDLEAIKSELNACLRTVDNL